MPTVRIISYNLSGCRDLSALYSTIETAEADFVALQNIASIPSGYNLSTIACNTGYQFYSQGSTGTLALMAHRRIKSIQTYDLGAGACCMKADIHIAQKRFYIFNINFRGNFFSRPTQIRRLLGPNLIDTNTLSLPTILLGDFYDIVWTSYHYRFNDQLRRFSPPFLRATYPSYCPLISRDRVYALGGIKLHHISIDHSKSARAATLHLPIITDVEVNDNRIAITSTVKDKPKAQQMEIAPG